MAIVQRYDNDGWAFRGRKHKIYCCDCGQAHLIAIVQRGSWTGMAVKGLGRETSNRRRMLKRKRLGVFAKAWR